MLGGVEGKIFKPMAVTVLFALAASLVIAMTLMPVLAYYAFRRGHTEKHPWLMRKLSNYYRHVLPRALSAPILTGTLAALLFAGSICLVPFMGAEFIPTLDEGSITVMMYRVPGISVAESLHGNEIVESVLLHFPEVDKVVSRLDGRKLLPTRWQLTRATSMSF